MFVLGLVLLLVGILLGINILFVIGLVLLIVGLCLFGLGYVGHPVGGRAHWF
jgi:hypothetical protein